MAPSPLSVAATTLALSLLVAPPSLGRPAEPGDSELAQRLYHPYRAETLGVVDGEAPRRVTLLPVGGPQDWPEQARARLSAQIRSAWKPGRALGAVDPAVALWLTYPLVTAVEGDHVLLPVVEERSLPIRGALVHSQATGPRQVVVLVDASSSANSPVEFRGPDGRAKRVSVLEAERRALRRLLDRLDGDRVKLGVIVFGETARGLVEPGASLADARAAIEADRRAHPAGEGRTDTICALWLAREWLQVAPRKSSREIVLLTDGDFPYSGRFPSCRHGSRRRREACQVRRNLTQCPASRPLRHADGESDLVQMHSFARHNRHRLKVHSLVFETDRQARPYAELSEATGGELVRVPSASAMLAALPALVGTHVRSVIARNLANGDSTPELLDPETGRFSGRLDLAPGANDVELRLRGPGGLAALYRFRIWFAPHYLEHFLAELEQRNRSLDATLGRLVDRSRSETRSREMRRSLEVAPAALDPSLD